MRSITPSLIESAPKKHVRFTRCGLIPVLRFLFLRPHANERRLARETIIENMDGDIGAWISSIPKVTRYWFFSFFILPLTTRLGLINPVHLILVPEQAIRGFQVKQWPIIFFG